MQNLIRKNALFVHRFRVMKFQHGHYFKIVDLGEMLDKIRQPKV